jgi:hypothetical protein
MARRPPPAGRRAPKQLCAQRDWPWVEPVNLSEVLREYHIHTNCSMRDGNVFIRIRYDTGAVTYAAFARR